MVNSSQTSEKRSEDRLAYEQLIHRLQARFSNLEPIETPPTLFLLRGQGFPAIASRNHDINLIGWSGNSTYGTGVSVVGERDADEETGTYITTLGLFVVGIPIVFRRAYRVLEWKTGLRKVSAPEDQLTSAIVRYCELRGDWYFIGREPLSGLALTWNVIVALGVLWLILKILFLIANGRPYT
jgi:hypothetical protein